MSKLVAVRWGEEEAMKEQENDREGGKNEREEKEMKGRKEGRKRKEE